ncbi:HupE/UreJ family protein [Isoptericola sp. BMS4]|uniref:HupE/UreJ family protein n=1 Tax=Isoptericola sp. BMS4 TaxID=2527875 RepID=UPI00141FDC12|nr:HupE/UreJ family protein [Isoptericola sp. BMS4]
MIRRLVPVGLAAATLVAVAGPAAAHDATSDVYADVSGTTASAGEGADSDVHATLDLEYDLLMKSAWLRADAYEVAGRAAQLAKLDEYEGDVDRYVTGRFEVAYDGEPCAPSLRGTDVVERGGTMYASLDYAFACDGEPGRAHRVTSALFPDQESFVHSTETLVRYDLDGERGSAVLTVDAPALVTGERQVAARLGSFFLLGAEHLLLGPDHVLFLLALLVGVRRLRDVVLLATGFTVAHSATFLLAALGLMAVPATVIEPVIAASIAVVAGMDLAGLWRAGPWVPAGGDPVGLRDALRRSRPAGKRGTRWDRWRLPVVVAFGLVHGLGFAGALGIDAAWSWDLLWSLLAFNAGIEAAQLALVALLFPLLALLRSRAPRTARWTVTAGTAAIALVALWWTAERLVQAG